FLPPLARFTKSAASGLFSISISSNGICRTRMNCLARRQSEHHVVVYMRMDGFIFKFPAVLAIASTVLNIGKRLYCLIQRLSRRFRPNFRAEERRLGMWLSFGACARSRAEPW